MSLDRRLLDLLLCPVTRFPLTLAGSEQLRALQDAAASGRLEQRDGQRLTQAPVAALLESRGGWAYPVVDDIPVLLPEAALRIADA